MGDQSRAGSPLTVCIAENRATCEPPLRILVASLARQCPGLPVVMFCPNATPAFARWLEQFASVSLNPCALDGEWTKYDIKPLALLTMLNAGHQSVMWIDSDILIARDFRPAFEALPSETLVVAEEALSDGHDDPGALRTRMWGWPVGRVLPFAANTGVIRVTEAHRALLTEWNALLNGEAYRVAQAAAWYERPAHMAGDQEVMTALLSSERYAGVPIRFVRRGRDIVQFFGNAGYTLAERLRHLARGMPYFVHSLGFRPWWPEPAPDGGWSARVGYVYRALSPYTVLAQDYAATQEDDGWLVAPTRGVRRMRWGSAPLTGLPLAILYDAARWARTMRRRGRQAVVQD